MTQHAKYNFEITGLKDSVFTHIYLKLPFSVEDDYRDNTPLDTYLDRIDLTKQAGLAHPKDGSLVLKSKYEEINYEDRIINFTSVIFETDPLYDFCIYNGYIPIKEVYDGKLTELFKVRFSLLLRCSFSYNKKITTIIMFCRPEITKMVINDMPLNVKETDLKITSLACNFKHRFNNEKSK